MISVYLCINKIIKQLYKYNYTNLIGNPIKNRKLIHFSIINLVKHYKNIEKTILNHYIYSADYKILNSKIHYIFKYSCAFTICNKMKLKTLKKTFKKYMKNYKIKNNNNKILKYTFNFDAILTE